MSHAVSDNPSLVSGILKEQRDGMVVLILPGTDYQLHLTVKGPVQAGIDGAVHGVIHAQARRVDVVSTGGRFIEPIYGRPRRLQGRIVAADHGANALTVHAGCPFVCKLMKAQHVSDFAVGALVSFDVERGAWFEKVSDLGGKEPAHVAEKADKLLNDPHPTPTQS